MDDFLYNLRRESDKRNKRQSHMQQQYRGPDRRTGKDKRNYQRRPDLEQIAEIMPEIKNLLGAISTNQNRMAEIEEQKVKAIEKVSDQLAEIIASGRGIGGVITDSAEKKVAVGLGAVALEVSQVDRDEITKLVLDMRQKGSTYKEIASHLEENNIPTFSGKGEWHAQTIHKICKQAN